MRIGREDNFLLIENSPLEGGFSACHIEAVTTASGRRFSALHDAVFLDTSEPALQRFAEFAAFKKDRLEITLTEGGWLRLERDVRGYITVRYRIGDLKTLAAMEGAVIVEGEFVGRFCRELGALLQAISSSSGCG
jgi:hypothetical protein